MQWKRDRSTSILRPYGTECLTPEVNPRDRYSKADIRVAFVRPTVVNAWFEMSSQPLKVYTLAAEVTRIAVLQRDANGRWRGIVNVTRDTLLYRLNMRDSTGTWIVCGMPGHCRGYNRDGSMKTLDAWQPVNIGDAEQKYAESWPSFANESSWQRKRIWKSGPVIYPPSTQRRASVQIHSARF